MSQYEERDGKMERKKSNYLSRYGIAFMLVAVLFLQWGGAQAVWRLWSRECLLDAEREVLWRGVLAYNLGLLRETTKAE